MAHQEAQRNATLEQQQKQLDTQDKFQRQDQLKKQQEMLCQQMRTQGYQLPMQQSYGYSADVQYMPKQNFGMQYGAAMPAKQTSSMPFSAAMPARQASSMQYVGYGAAMPLHAASLVPRSTTAAQRQEHNYWSLQLQQQRQEKQIAEQQHFLKQQVASIQQPDAPAAPFIPTPHGSAMPPMYGSIGGVTQYPGAEMSYTQQAPMYQTQSFVQPAPKEQQPSLQPQPQSQQLFDNRSQLSAAEHTS